MQDKAGNFNFPKMCLSCRPWRLLPFPCSYNRASVWLGAVPCASCISKEVLSEPCLSVLLIVWCSFVRQVEGRAGEKMLFRSTLFCKFVRLSENNRLGLSSGVGLLSESERELSRPRCHPLQLVGILHFKHILMQFHWTRS